MNSSFTFTFPIHFFFIVLLLNWCRFIWVRLQKPKIVIEIKSLITEHDEEGTDHITKQYNVLH